jgi:hypothetical protein
MPGQGRKGILQPESTVLCAQCNSRPAGDSGVPGICSMCVIMEKRGLKAPPDPLRPGQTPPPPRTPGYDKKTPQQK